MLSNYLPILIFLIVAAGLAMVLLVLGTGLGRFFSRHHDDPAKRSPYECGFDAFEDTRTKFDVRYYLVAILFIVFEVAFYAISSAFSAIPVLGVLAWYDVAVGNLIAAITMGWYMWRAHPALKAELIYALEGKE